MAPNASITPQGVMSTTWTMARRDLARLVRVPQLLVFNALQPLLFLVVFALVLGGAMDVPDPSYVDYLLPGILVMGVVFSSSQTGVAVADEMGRGLLDRLRSLPVSRIGILGGRIIADGVRTFVTVAAIIVAGLALGFRPAGAVGLVVSVVLLIAFGAAFSWLSTAVGLALREVEAVQAAAFVVILPLTFFSSAFAPISTMPTGVRVVAGINPVTWIVDAIRGLVHGQPDVATLGIAVAATGLLAAASAGLAVRVLDQG